MLAVLRIIFYLPWLVVRLALCLVLLAIQIVLCLVGVLMGVCFCILYFGPIVLGVLAIVMAVILLIGSIVMVSFEGLAVLCPATFVALFIVMFVYPAWMMVPVLFQLILGAISGVMDFIYHIMCWLFPNVPSLVDVCFWPIGFFGELITESWEDREIRPSYSSSTGTDVKRYENSVPYRSGEAATKGGAAAHGAQHH